MTSHQISAQQMKLKCIKDVLKNAEIWIDQLIQDPTIKSKSDFEVLQLMTDNIHFLIDRAKPDSDK